MPDTKYKEIATFSTIGGTLVVLDSLYLYLGRNNFKKVVSDIQGHDPKFSLSLRQRQVWSMVCIYILLSLLIYFVVLEVSVDWEQSLGYGGIVGFVVWGVYNLTNYSIFDKYPLELTMSDTLWGSVLLATASVFGFLVLDVF
jgi:uncharacterized membrane protein